MSWKDLDIKQKAEIIKLGVQSGLRDIKQIQQLYDNASIKKYEDGGIVDTPIQEETNVANQQPLDRLLKDYGIQNDSIPLAYKGQSDQDRIQKALNEYKIAQLRLGEATIKSNKIYKPSNPSQDLISFLQSISYPENGVYNNHKAVQFIKDSEGWVSTPYDDGYGNLTWGYGFTNKSGLPGLVFEEDSGELDQNTADIILKNILSIKETDLRNQLGDIKFDDLDEDTQTILLDAIYRGSDSWNIIKLATNPTAFENYISKHKNNIEKFTGLKIKDIQKQYSQAKTFKEKLLYPSLLVGGFYGQENSNYDKGIHNRGKRRYNLIGTEQKAYGGYINNPFNLAITGEYQQYKTGGKVDKPPFNDWYKTIPTNRNDTTSYNLRRAYELLPFEQLEKWRTATPEQLNNDEYHLTTVAPNGEFLKSKNHPTIKYELDWYNSEDGKDFRNRYYLDTTGEYYRYIPKVKQYNNGGYEDGKKESIIKNPLKMKKENSLEYRQALYNNVNPLNGYPSIKTAYNYYKNVIDKIKQGDNTKNWETDGSIGQRTSEAGWAKYLELPYEQSLFPIWNGDTVRLRPELEREIPIDTNFIKQDIQDILKDRELDRQEGIYDREQAYDIALKTRYLTLQNLRDTYKTGNWVQMNEFMFNGLSPFDWYNKKENYITPLNVLQNFALKYDKNTNSIIYRDTWDLNAFDYFLPGKPFQIKGSIPLNNKKEGGYILPKGIFQYGMGGGVR